jgi:hypothetical protein
VPRSNNLEWLMLYLFVLDAFCQVMSLVPVIGYWLWLLGLFLALVLFALLVLLLRFRRSSC